MRNRFQGQRRPARTSPIYIKQGEIALIINTPLGKASHLRRTGDPQGRPAVQHPLRHHHDRRRSLGRSDCFKTVRETGKCAEFAGDPCQKRIGGGRAGLKVFIGFLTVAKLHNNLETLRLVHMRHWIILSLAYISVYIVLALGFVPVDKFMTWGTFVFLAPVPTLLLVMWAAALTAKMNRASSALIGYRPSLCGDGRISRLRLEFGAENPPTRGDVSRYTESFLLVVAWYLVGQAIIWAFFIRALKGNRISFSNTHRFFRGI